MWDGRYYGGPGNNFWTAQVLKAWFWLVFVAKNLVWICQLFSVNYQSLLIRVQSKDILSSKKIGRLELGPWTNLTHTHTHTHMHTNTFLLIFHNMLPLKITDISTIHQNILAQHLCFSVVQQTGILSDLFCLKLIVDVNRSDFLFIEAEPWAGGWHSVR